MVRNHDMHMAAATERARVAQIAKHEQRIRENERAREQRRNACLVQSAGEYRDSYGHLVPNQDIAVEGHW